MLDSEAVLVTPRLRLEPLRKKHASKLFKQLQDLRLYRYYGGKPPQSLAALRQQYAAWEARRSPDGTQTWLNYALLRAKDNVYVGWVQATIDGKVATIGYDIFPKFWRNGYATESCTALVRLLQTIEAVHTIRAVVDTENEPSVRLLKRLGFTRVSTAPSDDMPGRQDFHYEMPVVRVLMSPGETRSVLRKVQKYMDAKKPPKTIDQYIEKFPPFVQKVLQRMRRTIRKAAPTAEETISYQIPTFKLNGNLVHFAAFKEHIGFYPTSSGIAAFKKELAPYKISKGTVQFPIDEPIPYDIVEKITVFRVKENSRKKR